MPDVAEAAALLAEGVGIVGELLVEGELYTWVLSVVVDFGSPCGERAECLGLRLVAPPALFEVFELARVAAVQGDDRAPRLLPPCRVAACAARATLGAPPSCRRGSWLV